MASSVQGRVSFIHFYSYFQSIFELFVCLFHIKSGILVPGGFGIRGTEGMIAAAEWARVNRKPYLGICLGFQCAVIDYCRHVLGKKDATSAEFNKESNNLVVSLA